MPLRASERSDSPEAPDARIAFGTGEVSKAEPAGVSGARNSPDEAALWRAWSGSRDGAARLALANRYMPYARSLAARLYAGRPNDAVGFDDYHQLAMVGLMEAIERYQLERGTQFTTFATPRIRGAILNGLERLTERHQQVAFRRRAEAERLESFIAEPMSLEHEDRLLEELEAVSVGVALGFILEGAGQPLGPEVALPEDAYARLEMRQVHQQVWSMVELLNPREREIIRMHYKDGIQFDDIAARLRLSKGRISQLHRQAVMRLRALINKAEKCDISY
jgi:RNA polymerase sigma factor for flagellar operon FliA